jgi:type I restriction enzyme R subunit
MINENLTEAQTRKLHIDKLLQAAGWPLTDHARIIEEFEIAGTGAGKYRIRQKQEPLNPSGYSDYLMLDRALDPLAIVEAKRTSRDPREGEQQAEDYADGIKEKFSIDPLIFMTNGYDIWFWNRQRYAPAMVYGFFTRDDLERLQHQNLFRKDLYTIPINTKIIDRDYQILALKRIYDGLNKNKRKFLLVMATGTGKTRTAMALIDVLFRAQWAERVLFLTDREVLFEQAWTDGFKKYLPDEARGQIRGGNIETGKRLYVTTIQTLNECFYEMSPAFFDIIISDECHRSIYNKWREVLSYFYAAQIGLTATPADYIDRDTFQFFDCTDRIPTFNYPFDDAVKDNFLSDFRPAYAAQTNFQIEGIKGKELPPEIQEQLITEGHDPDVINFEGTDLEKKVTNVGTNESLVKEFMDICIKDDTGTLPGKSIIFAVSHQHALRLVEIFDRLYPEYKGRLAAVIDSKMERPSVLINKFKKESFPRVAISVDMLDTGVDVREVVNLVFAKPVFSKIKFWQMIGRGTRKLEPDDMKIWCSKKDRFLIIDHWNNFERFDMKPEGEPPAIQIAVTVKIFRTRLNILSYFQKAGDLKNFDKVKQAIINDIKALPMNSTTIIENQRNIEKALSDQIWRYFDEKSLTFLDQVIAPLMRFKTDVNLQEVQFLLKIEQLGLAVLQSETDEVIRIREAVVNTIKRLPPNLSKVQAKKTYIDTVLSDGFWQNIDYPKVEYIKDNLIDIIKHVHPDENIILKLNLDDLITKREWIEFGPTGEGDYVASYREKVEKRIRDLAESHPALVKIKNDEIVTEQDLVDLESMLNSPELYIQEENLRKVFNQPYGTFIQFIKSILDKYKFPDPEELINSSFQTYIIERNNKDPLSAEQIVFLRAVKNVFNQKKHIEYEDLFEPPFTQLGTDAATRLFKEDELKKIIDIFNSVPLSKSA